MSRANLEERVAKLERHIGALLAGSSGPGATKTGVVREELLQGTI